MDTFYTMRNTFFQVKFGPNINKSILFYSRDVFRTLFLQKNSILDVWEDPKYVSVHN